MGSQFICRVKSLSKSFLFVTVFFLTDFSFFAELFLFQSPFQ